MFASGTAGALTSGFVFSAVSNIQFTRPKLRLALQYTYGGAFLGFVTFGMLLPCVDAMVGPDR